MTPVWLVLWSSALALTWLLPNHFPPWSTFHSDAWMAFVSVGGAFAVLLRGRFSLQWHGLASLALVLIFVPWLQFSFDLLPFAGQAWITSAYLLGFLGAMLMGSSWEEATPLQLAHALMAAVCIASAVSVGLQFYTWLGLRGVDSDLMNIWSIELDGQRPYANLGQPNQLATLLAWGLAACLWFHATGKLSGVVVALIAAFLLTGLALTQSRTGWLIATTLTLGTWYWRRIWASRRLPWVSLALYLFFLACPFILGALHESLLLGQDQNYARYQQIDGLRLAAWRVFATAILERPWFGYGWTEITGAQVAVSALTEPLHSRFAHSHNLFLDLLVWNGIPLGLVICIAMIGWFWTRFRAIRHPQDAAVFMLLVAVGIHAMLELPLHHAYFLLPAGMAIGILDKRLAMRPVFVTTRWLAGIPWGVGAVVLGLVISDYLRVEASYNAVRFEQARIGVAKTGIGGPPEVVLLTQMRELVNLGRFKRHPGMSEREMKWMTDMVRTQPTSSGLYQLAGAMAMNDRPQDALLWLTKICGITDAEDCLNLKNAWLREGRSDKRIAAVPWPDQ